MDTPHSLRARASRWRALAFHHAGELASLLHGAADEAERRAEALEGGPALRDGRRIAAAREAKIDAGAPRHASEISLKR